MFINLIARISMYNIKIICCPVVLLIIENGWTDLSDFRFITIVEISENIR